MVLETTGRLVLVGAVVAATCAFAACDDDESGEATAAESSGSRAATAPSERTGERAEDEQESSDRGEASDQDDQPLYAMFGEDHRVPIHTVILEKGDADGRLMFFPDEEECDAIPAKGETSDTVISILGVTPENPEWIGSVRTTEWWYMQQPDAIAGDGVEVSLDALDDDSASGHVKLVRAGPDRLFKIEGDFSAIVCAPAG